MYKSPFWKGENAQIIAMYFTVPVQMALKIYSILFFGFFPAANTVTFTKLIIYTK